MGQGGERGNGHLEHSKPGIDLQWEIISKGNLLKRYNLYEKHS